MKKILIVDDDSGTRGLLREIINDLGCETIVCKDGIDAVPYIDEADAIITDFNMPGMNGAELTAVARHKKPDMPIMIMTANTDGVPKDHLANKVIEKPFHINVIIDWLNEVMK